MKNYNPFNPTRYVDFCRGSGSLHCGRELTQAQYEYSMQHFEKPLCFSCQDIERMRRKEVKQHESKISK